MKTIHIILFCALIAIVGGCEAKGSENVTQAAAAKEVFVFIDKSGSVSFASHEVMQKAGKSLQKAVNLIATEGDAVSVLYLHNNTRSGGPVLHYSMPRFVVPAGQNNITVNKYKVAYLNGIRKQKSLLYDSTLRLFGVANNTVTKAGTDVLGVLEVLSGLSHTTASKTVYLFTDAKQSSKDFLTDPKSKAEAETLARQHAKKIPAAYAINPTVLHNTAVHFVLPYTNLATVHNPYLSYYWIELLKQFGITVDFV